MTVMFFDYLAKVANYCYMDLTGLAEPFDPQEPFELLAQKLREAPQFLEPAIQLAKKIGFNPTWPSNPKGKEEVETFLDLWAIELELFSIKWTSKLKEHMPSDEEYQKMLAFCDEVFHFARGKWTEALEHQS